MWQCFKSKKRKEQEELSIKEFLQKEEERKEHSRLREEWGKKCYQEMLGFRKIGERFNFLGVTLIVERIGGSCDYYRNYPITTINAKYVDKDGIIRNEYFSYEHLPMLKAENPS